MKIAIVSVQEFNPNIGGIERVSVSLAQALVQNGLEVIMVACREAPYSVEYKLPAKQVFMPSSDDYSSDNVDALIKLVKEEHIDAILNQNSHSYEFNRLCEEVKDKTGVKLISVFHFCPDMRIKNHHDNIDWKFYSLLKNLSNLAYNIVTRWPFTYFSMMDQKRLFRQIYNISDRVVLLSNRYKDDFMKIGSLHSGEKLCAIPNMLSFDVERNNCVKEKRILFCARFTVQKRPYRVLYIWKRLQDKLTDWNLDMVGDGPYLERCKELSKELALDRIVFHGFQHPNEYYKKSPIFLMTSNYEGWGLTLNESMQYGCIPVVFNSFKSLADIIDDGVNGFLVEPYDLDKFADTIYKFIISGKHSEFAKRAFASINRFSKERIASQWLELFTQVCSSK